MFYTIIHVPARCLYDEKCCEAHDAFSGTHAVDLQGKGRKCPFPILISIVYVIDKNKKLFVPLKAQMPIKRMKHLLEKKIDFYVFDRILSKR